MSEILYVEKHNVRYKSIKYFISMHLDENFKMLQLVNFQTWTCIVYSQLQCIIVIT